MMKNNDMLIFKNKIDKIVEKCENNKVTVLKIALETLKFIEKTSKAS